MKNTPLSDIRRKKANYFRSLGVVHPGRRRPSTIEYIVRRSFEALPKSLKEYIPDVEQTIQVITNTIIVSGEMGQMQPYDAMRRMAESYRSMEGHTTLAYIYARFREDSSLYGRYNSYMYRQGFSASRYFIQNATMTQQGSRAVVVCELPFNSGRIQYTELLILYDWSGKELEAFMN